MGPDSGPAIMFYKKKNAGTNWDLNSQRERRELHRRAVNIQQQGETVHRSTVLDIRIETNDIPVTEWVGGGVSEWVKTSSKRNFAPEIL